MIRGVVRCDNRHSPNQIDRDVSTDCRKRSADDDEGSTANSHAGNPGRHTCPDMLLASPNPCRRVSFGSPALVRQTGNRLDDPSRCRSATGGWAHGLCRTTREHIQFNEDSLWIGDEQDTGAYQAFGDLYVETRSRRAAKQYRRELDIGRAVHVTTYRCGGVELHRVSTSPAIPPR